MLSLIQLLQEPPGEQTFDCEQLVPRSDVSCVVDLVVNCLFGQTEDGSTQAEEQRSLEGRVSCQPPQQITKLAYPPKPGVSIYPESSFTGDTAGSTLTVEPPLSIPISPTYTPDWSLISHLDLSGSALETNPVAGIMLPCLRVLSLVDNHFVELRLDLSLTPELRILNLSDNLRLEVVCLVSPGDSRLVWLDLSLCHGCAELEIEGRLPKLQIADLSTTFIENLAPLASSNPQLLALNLNNGTVNHTQSEVMAMFNRLLVLEMGQSLPHEGVTHFRNRVGQLSV